MHTFTFPSKFIERFLTYRNSEEYSKIPNYSKSEYWLHHSGKITIDIHSNKITVNGSSGYYIPKRKWRINKPWFLKKNSRVKLLNYFEAFDAVMSHDSITAVISAEQHVNFIELSKKLGVVSRIQEMRKQFFAKNKYRLNPQIINAYCLWNILCGKTKIDSMKAILEIGAGNGNLSALLWSKLKATMVIIDLPETLCLSIPFIADLFPDANIIMPHEVNNSWQLQKYDFVFLTPNQLNWIKDNSIDLSINTFSFQEMTREQIDEYFLLIERVSKNNAYFLTQNRVEKIPTYSQNQSSEATIRFSEYPWMLNNEVIIYEICRLSRLVQLDDVYIRLEKIIK